MINPLALLSLLNACLHPTPLTHHKRYEVVVPIRIKHHYKSKWKSFLNAAEQEERLLALTAWGEARDQGERGIHAVINVVQNRAAADLGKRYGHGLTGVVWHRKQYSCWNPGDPNREAMRSIAKLNHNGRDWKMWMAAKKLAKLAVHNNLRDITRGSTYYHTGNITPAWEKQVRLTIVVGQHRFYRWKNDIA